MKRWERKAARRYEQMIHSPVRSPGAHRVDEPKPKIQRRDEIAWRITSWVMWHVASSEYRRRMTAWNFAAHVEMARRLGVEPISSSTGRGDRASEGDA